MIKNKTKKGTKTTELRVLNEICKEPKSRKIYKTDEKSNRKKIENKNKEEKEKNQKM